MASLDSPFAASPGGEVRPYPSFCPSLQCPLPGGRATLSPFYLPSPHWVLRASRCSSVSAVPMVTWSSKNTKVGSPSLYPSIKLRPILLRQERNGRQVCRSRAPFSRPVLSLDSGFLPPLQISTVLMVLPFAFALSLIYQLKKLVVVAAVPRRLGQCFPWLAICTPPSVVVRYRH